MALCVPAMVLVVVIMVASNVNATPVPWVPLVKQNVLETTVNALI
jgi:hypothetical protein